MTLELTHLELSQPGNGCPESGEGRFEDAPHMRGDDCISDYLGGIRLACAVIDE
ncbi:hypothetical protein OG440_36880 [Streptomyces sp. NBC_00637]|uniref:hypothetical protein n=1 Tax=Streptomyces sp. NBC_00637 TaxID=2903667 RepID=UPI003255C46E